MGIGKFCGGRDGLFIEVAPGYPRELAAVTMSREEREICRLTGTPIAAFSKTRAKRLAGVDPVSGRAAPVPDERPALQPYPPEDAADAEDDDATTWMLRTGAAGVKFPKTITERRPDGRITRRKADR